MTTLTVELHGQERVFKTDDFPLGLGGRLSHIALPDNLEDGPAAYLGQDQGDIFIQPAKSPPGGTGVRCNGVAVTASRWLEDGDLVTVGSTRMRFSKAPGTCLLAQESAGGRPRENPHPRAATAFHPAPAMAPVVPLAFTPRWQAPVPARAVRVRPRTFLVAGLFIALATCAWYVLTARSVVVVTTPPADTMTVGGGIAPGVGGRFLLRPGTYRLLAERSGHLPLDTEFDVGPGTPAVLRFPFEPLGGTVTVRTRPVHDAFVVVDGRELGPAPIHDLPLSAGEHSVEVRAPLHLASSATITIEPGQPPLVLEATLEPNWAPVTVTSSPTGAELSIDGSTLGTTPATIEVEAGPRILEIRKAGHKPETRSLQLTAGEAVDLGVIVLRPLDGRMAVSSQPGRATVTIGSEYRGTTPVELAVPPNIPLELRVSLADHATFSTEVTVPSGERVEVLATLEMLTGEVVITSTPPGAELVIDGESRGRTGQSVHLEAQPHDIEVRLEGYLPFRTTLTPEPGLTQAVRAALKPAGPAGMPKSITTPQGVELILVGPGSFEMGASRREPGRRANEVLREVEITRAYYLGVREVSNREFREFKKEHMSGSFGGHNLEIDHHPVVNVSWEDAARYCNWLSQRAGLPPVYVERAGTLVPRSPLPQGYRLPTEAEWAWAARYAESSSPVKYAWGDSLPVPAGTDNFGDAAAQPLLGAALPGYVDGYVATAPVGSFPANSLGVYNLGGNVAEWVHDLYALAPGTPGVVERDPTGPASGTRHVVRGAGWMDTTVTELRLSYRDHSDRPRPDLGFRIARSAQ